MNTLTNTSAALSFNSIDLLASNGYQSQFSEKLTQFKRTYDFIGPFILLFLFAIISLPLFDYSYWMGASLFIVLVIGIYIHRQLISKKSNIRIDSDLQRIEISNRFGTHWFQFNQVDSIYIQSIFNGSFTNAEKLRNEEYDISIGITLKSGKMLDLFSYKSDLREPTEEMMEVHDYLKSKLQEAHRR